MIMLYLIKLLSQICNIHAYRSLLTTNWKRSMHFLRRLHHPLISASRGECPLSPWDHAEVFRLISCSFQDPSDLRLAMRGQPSIFLGLYTNHYGNQLEVTAWEIHRLNATTTIRKEPMLKITDGYQAVFTARNKPPNARSERHTQRSKSPQVSWWQILEPDRGSTLFSSHFNTIALAFQFQPYTTGPTIPHHPPPLYLHPSLVY